MSVQFLLCTELLKPFGHSSLPLLQCNITQPIPIYPNHLARNHKEDLQSSATCRGRSPDRTSKSDLHQHTARHFSASTCSIAKVTNSSSTLLGNLLLTFKRVSTKIILCLHVCICLTYTYVTCIHYTYIHVYIGI